MTRILIVEDHADLAFGLRKTLEYEGYDVVIASDGPTGLEQAGATDPELIVLDLMLPGMDGLHVLEQLRGSGGTVPVLILTARADEADVVRGLELGADDYVTKPFSTLELVARVRALLRRGANGSAGGEPFSFGDVEVDPGAHTVRRAGVEVQLTPKEFDLLVALAGRDGAAATRAELLSQVWRYANPDVLTRTVDIHVAELRRKLEHDPANPRHILTVRKVGYRLQA